MSSRSRGVAFLFASRMARRKLVLPRSVAALASLALVWLVMAVQPVFAASLVVTTTADSGPGSLREAITDPDY